MARLKRKVHILVSEPFFKEFEKMRTEYQKALGLRNLSQANFTELLRKQNLTFPKLNINPFGSKNAKTIIIKKGRR